MTATVHRSSDGTANKAPAPKRSLKVELVIGTDWRLVSQRATPASSPMVASVTRNDGRRRKATSAPLTAPMAVPAASPAAAPTNQASVRRTMEASSAEIATIEPIDRSISPAVSTKTMPTAMTVTGAVCWTMLRRLRVVRKPSSRRTIENATRMIRKPT